MAVYMWKYCTSTTGLSFTKFLAKKQENLIFLLCTVINIDEISLEKLKGIRCGCYFPDLVSN